ncbi:GNAT family N-acetyltransferase [Parasphingopyxis lamellibrachiae]|uniref:RimJ/RimL family protein N-acetyltransferase n=1 Tax=Parasphingopyxis lamellibrachiae TaxID=680125 RepID=A0A3D9FDU3_9SPHN|nr:GNAT family N-acetyltransferase [Parasphingopyxis lamellibrachiae]RED15747.1 RimJ/RimL family protein N-acetyltransferase [Parasphingopyxis lamellibrachiae]
MSAIIETDRLILRDWRDADREPMFRHCNSQPNVMRFLLGVQTRVKTDKMIDKFIRWQGEYGHTFWAVERKDDGELLGFCGLKRINDDGVLPDPGTMEIGWRLREDAWGRGYAREAAAASMSYAFDTFDPDFVSAFTVKGNAGSWGLMKRLGMVRREDLDHWYDEWGPDLGNGIVYRITREDWAGKHGEFEQRKSQA